MFLLVLGKGRRDWRLQVGGAIALGCHQWRRSDLQLGPEVAVMLRCPVSTALFRSERAVDGHCRWLFPSSRRRDLARSGGRCYIVGLRMLWATVTRRVCAVSTFRLCGLHSRLVVCVPSDPTPGVLARRFSVGSLAVGKSVMCCQHIKARRSERPSTAQAVDCSALTTGRRSMKIDRANGSECAHLELLHWPMNECADAAPRQETEYGSRADGISALAGKEKYFPPFALPCGRGANAML